MFSFFALFVLFALFASFVLFVLFVFLGPRLSWGGGIEDLLRPPPVCRVGVVAG